MSSLIQIGGRVNRHGNGLAADVWDFCAGDAKLTPNPSLEASRAIVSLAFKKNHWETMTLSDLMTWAITEEWKRYANDEKAIAPVNLERQWEFAEVAQIVKLIDDDAALAVVDRSLVDRLRSGKPVSN